MLKIFPSPPTLQHQTSVVNYSDVQLLKSYLALNELVFTFTLDLLTLLRERLVFSFYLFMTRQQSQHFHTVGDFFFLSCQEKNRYHIFQLNMRPEPISGQLSLA